MQLKRFPTLLSFFSTYCADSTPEEDEQSAHAFLKTASSDRQSQIVSELKLLMGEVELSLEELGTEANRWFADISEARVWLNLLLGTFQGSETTADQVVVKDSHGTILNEGDSVIVIKDLKVKGGSSDLKRGTAIKKIHLVGDPEAVECRVDGSTLVLKTMFLKKS